jgi:hypothetical protein
MSRRPVLVLFVIALLSAGVLLAGCSRTVRVETGERIVCTYGEVVTDTIRTVEVPAAEAADYKVIRETITCDRHKRLEALYAAGQAAILAGDLTTARENLAEVVKTEPQFRNAQQQIDAIDAGQKPVVDTSAPKAPASGATSSTPGGTTPGGPTDSPGKEPVGPVASLSSFVPDTLPGYKSTPIIADATSASTFTVSGRSVYFGTDAHRFAIVAWNEQGIVVVIEGSSRTGKPEALKSHLTSLVGAIVQ